jgi:hypothetical protein
MVPTTVALNKNKNSCYTEMLNIFLDFGNIYCNKRPIHITIRILGRQRVYVVTVTESGLIIHALNKAKMSIFCRKLQ